MKTGFLIDMDGVIYVGDQMIPGADTFIKQLQNENIPFAFMTNNSQRTPLEAVRKLAKMGIEVGTETIYTSAMATGSYLAQNKGGKTAFVLGEGGLLTSLHENGITLVQTDPDYVVVGEGINFTLEMCQKAVNMLLAGAKLVATNLDLSPRKPGWNNLGIKSITTMLEEASGKNAFSVGKPSPVMMRYARKHIGLETAGTTVIGDTMSTDILGGTQMSYKTILVLSGMTNKDDLDDFPYSPDMLLSSVKDLTIPLPWWGE